MLTANTIYTARHNPNITITIIRTLPCGGVLVHDTCTGVRFKMTRTKLHDNYRIVP